MQTKPKFVLRQKQREFCRCETADTIGRMIVDNSDVLFVSKIWRELLTAQSYRKREILARSQPSGEHDSLLTVRTEIKHELALPGAVRQSF